jgi:hypothetical protein
MNREDLEKQDDDNVAKSAIQALTVAFQRARGSGRAMVLVENGELIRIGPGGKTVLSQLPVRRKVAIRVKKAKT